MEIAKKHQLYTIGHIPFAVGLDGVIAAGMDDFVATLMRRFADIEATSGSPGLVVAGYDTELFGHWWYEGPQWLEALIRTGALRDIDAAFIAKTGERIPILFSRTAVLNADGEIQDIICIAKNMTGYQKIECDE